MANRHVCLYSEAILGVEEELIHAIKVNFTTTHSFIPLYDFRPAVIHPVSSPHVESEAEKISPQRLDADHELRRPHRHHPHTAGVGRRADLPVAPLTVRNMVR